MTAPGEPTAVLAVDWGASSIRVGRVAFPAGNDQPIVDIVHRYEHQPVRHADGSLRWDLGRLLTETERGLTLGLAKGPVASIGVDTWGVDYGLLDDAGRLVAAPWSYRDRRTDDFRAVLDRIGRQRWYSICGLQALPFTTIFQLAAHRLDELEAAARLVLLPDLVVHHLTGRPQAALTTERTAAGTTGLLDVHATAWSDDLIEAAGVERSLFSPIAEPGTRAGEWNGVPVQLVGGHDTASAVAGGGDGATPYVASGTWLLVGCEQAAPDTSEASRRLGITNEQSVRGGVRRLTNVAGWWLVDECAREWGVPVAELLTAAERVDVADARLFDATDDRFVHPPSMPDEIVTAAGLPAGASRAVVARSAIESMAATAARVASGFGRRGLRVFGGGARSSLFIEALRRHSGEPVSVGPVEATVIGNARVQLAALSFTP